MSTIIIIEATRDDDVTTDEQWALIREHFTNRYSKNTGYDDSGDYINSGKIYCPFSAAYLAEQIPLELREKIKGSEIRIALWYEEREPDEEETY